jgi:GTPase SAR1 family protein
MKAPPATSDLLRQLKTLRQFVNGSSDGRILSRIDDELSKLERDRFYLVVIGQFKRGKTTFINALLGEEILPVGVVPVTSVVTLIQYGSERQCEVIFSDNRRQRIQPDELREFVTEQGNPLNHKGVRQVEVSHPSPFLEQGTVLVDTPGIGSLYRHNTEATQEFVPNIDAAIVVLSADLPITNTEYDFLDEVLEHSGKLFFVLNKIDVMTEAEIQDAYTYAEKALRAKIKTREFTFVPLSARIALEEALKGDTSSERSGLGAFKRTIEAFARTERHTILRQRSEKRIEGLVAEARFTVELELKAVMTPLGDLQAKIVEFERRSEHLSTDRRNFGYLLTGQVQALTHWIDDLLDQFTDQETTRLTESLTAWSALHANLSAGDFKTQLQSVLASNLVADFDDWRKKNESLIIERYEQIISTYVERTNQFIQEIWQLSAELFEVHIQPVDDIEPVQWKATFYYQLQDDPRFFSLDVLTPLVALVPGGLYRRRILKQVLHAAADKTIRHSNKLKYEYSYSIQEHYRRFQFDLNEKIDGIIKQIHAILAAAMAMKSERETRVASYTEGLRERMDQLRSIGTSPEDTG